jgi:ElaB/YqjD/DUF883 family membrane-anchored ribosome-binding protein
MTTIQTEASNKLNGLSADLKGKLITTEKSIGRILHNAGEKVEDVATKIVNSTTKTLRNSREYIEENPGKGVAIAVSVGFITGSLLTAFMSRNKK